MSIGDLNAEDLEGLVGRVLDGRYLLDKFIDRGGFGAVYRGIDKKFNLPVAVKVGLSYREFMKEAKLAAEVRHDHIVQVSDYGNDNGIAYLVMEFLYGDDLEKLFKNQGCRLTTDQIRMFVSHVGDALAHAHAEQLIHRDLKPRNIILKQSQTRAGISASPGKFVLLDFGIAAKLDAEGTQRNRTQDGAGTLEYMAPELLKVKPTTTVQSDIYAFGILLYQMLTGRVPYPQSDTSHLALAEIVRAISVSPPPRFAEVAPDRTCPAAVEELVLQCLEKDPARRPQSMADVKDRFLKAFAPTTRPREDYSQTIRPDALTDSIENGISRRSQSWQTDRNQPKPSYWLRFLTLFVLIAALAVAGMQFFRPTTPPLPILTVMHGNEIVTPEEGSPLDLTAGDSVTVIFSIDDAPHGAIPEFSLPDCPEGIQVQMLEGSTNGNIRNFVVSVPDLNVPPGTRPPITFHARLPNQTSPFEKSISLNIRRPVPWLPDSLHSLGFQESSDSRLCRVGNDLFASILERRLGRQTVRFRLIPERDDARTKTFYIMERLVTNALFNEFATAEPEFAFQPRNQAERGWEAADQYPVTDVYVLEAQRFAIWLAGKLGSLPSTKEWDVSAGYVEFLHALEQKFGQSPFEIPPAQLENLQIKDVIPVLNAEVWIGLGPAMNEFRPPQGIALKGCSPYACRYDRLQSEVQPTEMTSTLVDFANFESDLRELCRHRIPDKNDKSLTDNRFEARLRGSGEEKSTDAFLWVKSERTGLKVRSIQDLNDAGSLSLLPDGIAAHDSYIGFRVVVQVNPDRK